MSKQVSVGIADMKILRQEGTLITYALGSCIGITFYDPMIKLGALLHIMLPEAGATNVNPMKFADTGIQETLRKFYVFGGMKGRIVCKIAGGAKMFEMKGQGGFGNIGERNIQSVKKILRQEGIRITGEDTGANYARTMLMDLSSGEVRIRTVGKSERSI